MIDIRSILVPRNPRKKMREPVNQVRGTQSHYIRNHIGFEVLDLAFFIGNLALIINFTNL